MELDDSAEASPEQILHYLESLKGPKPPDSPILPGFYPDPSICRVGDDYYLATSSFEYFPGVPLFHSRDLTTWAQIGNVLSRPTQLTVRAGHVGASKGIYAPTLRFHDGLFWLTTMNFEDAGKGHLIVHATDPAGEWSDPVYTEGAVGLDPDLAWDHDGTCYVTWASPWLGIAQAQVDPLTGKLGSEPASIWSGTGLADAEAPHLFHREGYWYLVLAEGGTDRGHCVTIARSRSIRGPFDGNPANPILTHRSTDHPIQSTGHADFVGLVDGTWALVHLGVRLRGPFPRYHLNGRETFLAGVDWEDGWPVVVEDRFVVPPPVTAFVEDFSGETLGLHWISPGVDPGSFAAPTEGGLRLSSGRAPAARGAEGLLAVRLRDPEWQVTATIGSGDAAVIVRIDDDHWAGVERRGDDVLARLVVGPLDQILGIAHGVGSNAPLVIRCAADPAGRNADLISLGYMSDEFEQIAQFDGRYISTEVAGGFTGRVVGVEALGGPALVSRFEYTPR